MNARSIAALKRGRVDVALASVLSDAGLCVSEEAQFRWRDVIDAEDGAGLVHIERSKTDQEGEGAFVAITPETYEALKQLRQDSRVMPDADVPVFGLSMSQISRRVVNMARAAGLGDGYSSHSGCVDLAIRMTRRGLRCRRSRHTGAGSYRQCQPDILGSRRWSTTVTLAVRGPV